MRIPESLLNTRLFPYLLMYSLEQASNKHYPQFIDELIGSERISTLLKVIRQ